MNSSFVLCAYFAMVLSPCFVATYGDMLSVRWLVALARRRRTHRAESFGVSVRYERYAMAIALEASFAASASEEIAAPRPFLVPKPSVAMDTPAFVQGRQRVAARLAQLAVAQKLRHAAEKVVAIPADIPVVADSNSVHIRPRRVAAAPVFAAAPAFVAASAAAQSVLAESARQHTHLVFRNPASHPHRELDSVASLSSPPRTAPGPEAVPPLRKPGESGAVEAAA